ncbi:MAG: hypothetical protein KDE08_17510 [Rhodobacteraceae bacterium]|nr:hypothetical protein [Paracoccaceae bacterium]
MNSTPEPTPDLRFLKLLVTVLAGTMIAGLITIVALLVIRLPKMTAPAPALPEAITLPEGQHAQAVTYGRGWYAVVTDTDEILIFDAETRQLQHRVKIGDGQNP